MRKLKRLWIAVLAVCCLVLAACQGDGTVTDITLKATGLKDNVLTISQGDEVTVSADIKPTDTDAAVSWKITDSAVASVSDKGVVKGLSAGQTTLTVSAGGMEKTIQVCVTEYIPVTEITFPSESVEVDTGVRKQIEYSVVPENATNKVLRFSVEPADAGVKVSSSGVIEVESTVEGGTEFIITASSAKEQNVTATLKLIVRSYELEDIKLVESDFYTEITSITVPLDEPYRVIFQQAVPEKAVPVGESLETDWTSSDESVCTVNEKGRLSFHKEGTAVITMSSNGIVKEIPVTVTAPSGNFVENYYIPQAYIDAIKTIQASTENGWHEFADFRNGGTGAEVAKQFVFEKYKYGTGPSSWFAGGGYCVEMGGWDNIHSGLEDDDLPGGGMANLYMWTKVSFGKNAQKLRVYFQYRQSDATFKYKLRFTVIDPVTKEITHLQDWQTGEFKNDPNLVGDESYMECELPAKFQGKTVLMLLEYDDIDYTTDGLINGVESVNIKYFSVMNNDGVKVDNAMWVIGASTDTQDFSSTMWDEIASETGHTLFRDTISGSTIAPASSIGIVDHIDSKLYENNFAPFGEPKVIVITRGSNDVYWSSQPGNALKLGDPDSTDKTTTYGAIRYTLDYLTTLYPNARIIWSNMGYREDADEASRAEFNKNLAAIIAEYDGVELLDRSALSGINAENAIQYLIDGIHPTKAGIKILKQMWLDAIRNP